MGLAASQARFLAVTARKADCEFRSMQIAQNKLSVTRELQAATETYQNALNATMFVWDGNGSGTDNQAFSYGIMMTPSAYNNYNPYMLTDRGGRIVVTDSIAAAAKAAGIDPDYGGTRDDLHFIKFLAALGKEGIVSNKTMNDLYSATFKNAKYTGLDGQEYTSLGQDVVPVYLDAKGNVLGKVYKNYPINPQQSSSYNWNSFYQNPEIADMPNGCSGIGYVIAYREPGKEYIKDYNSTEIMVSDITAYADSYAEIISSNEALTCAKFYSKIVKSNYDAANGFGSDPMSKNMMSGLNLSQLISAFKDGKIKSVGEDIELDNIVTIESGNASYYNGTKYLGKGNYDLKISDILSGNVIISYEKQESAAKAVAHNYEEYFEQIINEIGVAIGVMKKIQTVKEDGTLVTTIIPADQSYANTFELAKNLTLGEFGKNAVTTTTKNPRDAAKAYNGWQVKEEGSSNYSSAFNLSNMIKYFLTAVTMLEDGFDSNYAIDDKVSKCNFVTSDPSYYWVVRDDSTVSDASILKSDFYMQLFNNLCVNGYKTDERVNEEDYLEQMLKNGSYFISSLNNDGYFYQTRYSDANNSRILVVDDKDAIAVAESEYNYKKIKLTAKEDKLDLEMKNIDMELSSLTAEYDSVKNLIAKSIEKTFKQFEG